MTGRLLDFAPPAWQEYQRLRAGELGGRLRQALEQLAGDPALMRTDPRSRRHLIIEQRLRQRPQVWGLLVDAPDGTQWLVVWREIAPVIEIGYLGPAPSASGSAGVGGRPTSVS